MADKVHYALETFASQMNEYLKFEIFTNSEANEILRKRQRFEYKIMMQAPQKNHFLKYIEYEVSLQKIFLQRLKNKEIPKRMRKYIKNNINRIFKFALIKYKTDISLWKEYIDFCTYNLNSNYIENAYNSFIRYFPNDENIWLDLANWVKNDKKSIELVRKMHYKGLKNSEKKLNLYCSLFLLEADFANSYIEEGDDNETISDLKNGQIPILVIEDFINNNFSLAEEEYFFENILGYCLTANYIKLFENIKNYIKKHFDHKIWYLKFINYDNIFSDDLKSFNELINILIKTYNQSYKNNLLVNQILYCFQTFINPDYTLKSSWIYYNELYLKFINQIVNEGFGNSKLINLFLNQNNYHKILSIYGKLSSILAFQIKTQNIQNPIELVDLIISSFNESLDKDLNFFIPLLLNYLELNPNSWATLIIYLYKKKIENNNLIWESFFDSLKNSDIIFPSYSTFTTIIKSIEKEAVTLLLSFYEFFFNYIEKLINNNNLPFPEEVPNVYEIFDMYLSTTRNNNKEILKLYIRLCNSIDDLEKSSHLYKLGKNLYSDFYDF